MENKQEKQNTFEKLLRDIYTQYLNKKTKDAQEVFDSSTETSCLSDVVSRQDITESICKKKEKVLLGMKTQDLKNLRDKVEERVVVISARLVRLLKQKSRLKEKNSRHCDTITAILQAVSQKRKVDAQIKFSLRPQLPSQDAFQKWADALRAIIQLPDGLPAWWRKRVWLVTADTYLAAKHPKLSDWSTVKEWVFSDRVHGTDETLGNQIVKDLHRTGCSLDSEDNGEGSEDALKRVLVAYARWNKQVGYCQGFNVICALLLRVMDNDEWAAFKVMAYLVDHVLPENYFSNDLRALSVDMAVFRHLLEGKSPKLALHLNELQKNSNLENNSYEPPLTNVFTMQWFLTLFATFLPLQTVLRVWDSLVIDGNEVLMQVALVVWKKLEREILSLSSADEFYQFMTEVTAKATCGNLLLGDELVTEVYKVEVGNLEEIREKYTYNITPFHSVNGHLEDVNKINAAKSKTKKFLFFSLKKTVGNKTPEGRTSTDISALERRYRNMRGKHHYVNMPPLATDMQGSTLNHLMLGKSQSLPCENLTSTRKVQLQPRRHHGNPLKEKTPIYKEQNINV